MSGLRVWPVLVVLAVISACGAPRRTAISAAELARARDRDALVVYLSQPAADPAVCDAASPGPHILIDDKIERGLVDALRTGKVQPAPWRACIEHVFESGSTARRISLVDRILGAYASVFTSSAIGYDPRVQARLVALHDVYLERAPEIVASPKAIAALASQLRKRLDGGKLGPFARQRAADLLATFDLERGVWEQQIVDAALLDRLVVQRDERLLARFAARLPAAQRAQARLRLVRLRIAASPYPEVRDDAARVEEIVMRLGRNPVAPQAPSGARIDATRLALRGVVVRQRLNQQTAGLADASLSPAAIPMIAPIALRDTLGVELAGISRPITLCAPARALDPTPCLLPADVVVNSPLVWRDRDDGVHFVEQITAEQAVALARRGATVSLPISVAGHPVTRLEWPLAFSRTDSFVFPAGGPALHVTVEEHAGRLIYEVDPGDGVLLAVAERADASGFRIVSRGADGMPGSAGLSGSSGSDGMNGMDASCPYTSGSPGGAGGDGTDGGNGGNGGNGENGGDIDVVVHCEQASCDHTVAMLREAIRSEGGAGGPGGSGGSGGSGGRGGYGGSGASCKDSDGNVSTLSSGSPGASGGSGRDGYRGSDGGAGAPGLVRFDIRLLGSR